MSTTSFFPHPLRALVVITAGSCSTGISLSPHDVDAKQPNASSSSSTCAWWSPEWSDHYPLPLADGAVEAILRRYVESMIDRYSPASHDDKKNTPDIGILIVSSAANHRFYESWCGRWGQAHCISTGECRRDEPAARSMMRALRAVPLQTAAAHLECVSFIDADALVQQCTLLGEETVDKIKFGTSSILPHLIVRQQQNDGEPSSRTEVRAADDSKILVGMSYWGSEACVKLLASSVCPTGCGEGDDAVEDRVDVVKVAGLTKRNVLQRSATIVPTRCANLPLRVVGRSHARVGLIGNPSDQLHGKSMAVSVSNWWSTVTIEQTADVEKSQDGTSAALVVSPTCPAGSIDIVAHPVADATAVSGFDALHRHISGNGYVGGVRLLQATFKRFYELVVSQCSAPDAEVAAVARSTLQHMRSGSIRVQYDTNVPRQVGLAGSSCIVSAALKALLQFYSLTAESGELLLPEQKRPTFVLEVEAQELNINAGLMDRVAQMFEGVVEMDFSDPERTEREGHAVYTRRKLSRLPPLHLAIALDPSDSGKIHAGVRAKFQKGDADVVAAVRLWVGFVDQASVALEKNDHDAFRDLMDANFDLRRKLYGDECLGWKNLRMVEIARTHKAATKFPGSGGAVLVAARPGKTDVAALTVDMEKEGFSLVALEFVGPEE